MARRTNRGWREQKQKRIARNAIRLRKKFQATRKSECIKNIHGPRRRTRDAGADAENIVTHGLAIREKNPRSRVYNFIHTSELSDKLLDHEGADFLIQLRALPEDIDKGLQWLNFATLLLQVKRTSGSLRPKKDPRQKSRRYSRFKNHFKKHPRILIIAVNGKNPEKVGVHIENLIRRLVYGLKIPAPTPPHEKPEPAPKT